MTTKFRYSRNLAEDGSIVLKKVHPDDTFPERHVFSAGFVNSGGIEAVMEDYRTRERAGEDTSDLNTTPSFTRQGDDLVFPFDSGPLRYRFVGFEERDGIENRDALIYELVG